MTKITYKTTKGAQPIIPKFGKWYIIDNNLVVFSQTECGVGKFISIHECDSNRYSDIHSHEGKELPKGLLDDISTIKEVNVEIIVS